MSNITENDYSLKSYESFNKINNKKQQDRLITYVLPKSKQLAEMMVWYLESSHQWGIDLKALKIDMASFIAQLNEEQSTVKFVFPKYFKKEQFSTFFDIFFHEIEFSMSSQITEVIIYFESY